MLTSTSGLAQLRPYYIDDTRELLRVLLNSTSAAEANIVLDLLSEDVPVKSLVTACNLREVLRELPRSPFPMAVDTVTLARVAGLERSTAALNKQLDDEVALAVTTAGNLVLDLIVRSGAEKYFWTPIPVVDDYVNPDIVDLLIEHESLLDEVIALVKSMGIVFNPAFYMSLEDFALENASDAFAGLGALFAEPKKEGPLDLFARDLPDPGMLDFRR